MSIEDMTDLEFQAILQQCIERLENENHKHTLIKGIWNHALIIIDEDDEVNDQITLADKDGWIDFQLMIRPTKIVKQ